MVSLVYVTVIIDVFLICCEMFHPQSFCENSTKPAFSLICSEVEVWLNNERLIPPMPMPASLATLPSVVMQEFCALFLHTTFHKKWQWQGLRGQNVLKYGWTRQILHMTHHQLTSFSLVKRYFFACHIGFSWFPNCISHIDESTKSYQTSVVCFNGVALDCSFESSKAQSPSRGE